MITKYRVWSIVDQFYVDVSSGTLSVEHSGLWNFTDDSDVLTDDEMIVQPYIGKDDKHGIEIYEGDIVKYIEKMDDHGDAQEFTGIVFYDPEEAAFGLGTTPEKIWHYFTDRVIDHFEVIGNTLENPDLI